MNRIKEIEQKILILKDQLNKMLELYKPDEITYNQFQSELCNSINECCESLRNLGKEKFNLVFLMNNCKDKCSRQISKRRNI